MKKAFRERQTGNQNGGIHIIYAFYLWEYHRSYIRYKCIYTTLLSFQTVESSNQIFKHSNTLMMKLASCSPPSAAPCSTSATPPV
jgi:hypothetical protein